MRYTVFQHMTNSVMSFLSGFMKIYTDLIGNMIKGVRNVMAAPQNALL